MKPNLLNLFMKKLTRERLCAHHLSQSLLTQLRNYTVFPSLFSELCPEQRDSGAPQFVHDQSSQSLALNIVIVYVEQRFALSSGLPLLVICSSCGSRSFSELIAFS